MIWYKNELLDINGFSLVIVEHLTPSIEQLSQTISCGIISSYYIFFIFIIKTNNINLNNEFNKLSTQRAKSSILNTTNTKLSLFCILHRINQCN